MNILSILNNIILSKEPREETLNNIFQQRQFGNALNSPVDAMQDL